MDKLKILSIPESAKVWMTRYQSQDPLVSYKGKDLKSDLISHKDLAKQIENLINNHKDATEEQKDYYKEWLNITNKNVDILQNEFDIINNQTNEITFWNDSVILLKDLIEKCLQYEPSKRITSKEALKHPWFDTL